MDRQNVGPSAAPSSSSTFARTSQEVTPRFVSEIFPHPSLPVQAYIAIAASLQAFVDEKCKTDLQGYVWNREPLRFGVSGCAQKTSAGSGQARAASRPKNKKTQNEMEAGNSSTVPRIVASMRHGGSVEDEWLAVHLLMLATGDAAFTLDSLRASWQKDEALKSPLDKASGPGLVANISDEDGQFVLIETSEVAPKWIQPSNAEGRLWLANGRFHLIGPDVHSGDGDAEDADHVSFDDVFPLKVLTASSILFQDEGNKLKSMQASDHFQNVIISQRMPSFPSLEWAQDTQHRTLAFVSTRAARILHAFPQIVSDAAEAFEAREGPMDARRLRDMAVFGPEASASGQANLAHRTLPQQSPKELLVQIQIPRRRYATLLAEKYFPPKSFGAAWREAVANYWEILETEGKEIAREDQVSSNRNSGQEDPVRRQEVREDGRRRDLGCKITCGLELVFASVKVHQRSAPRDLFASGSSDDEARGSPAYEQFIASLTSLGFFGSAIRDSKIWKDKEEEALALWKQTTKAESQGSDQNTTLQDYSSDRFTRLLTAEDDVAKENELPPYIDPTSGSNALRLKEDPDSFLYDTLSRMAAENHETQPADGEGDDARAEKEAAEQLSAFSSKLQGFVDGEGDVHGALFDDEVSEDGESDHDDEESLAAAREQIAKMSPTERARAMEGLVPSLHAGEWGARATQKQEQSNHAGLRESGEAEGGDESKLEEIATESVKAKLTQRSYPQRRNGRMSGFSRQVRYDGASDSEESIDDEVLRAGDTEEDRQNRARFLGMERELEQENEWRRQAKEDGDLPAEDTVNEVDEKGELDDTEEVAQDTAKMDHRELQNFLDFARNQLGLSPDQYEALLDERRTRGAYVPDFSNKSAARTANEATDGPSSAAKGKQVSLGKSVKTSSESAIAADKAVFGSNEMDEDDEAGDGSESFPGVDEYGVKHPGKLSDQKKQRKSDALNNRRTTSKEKEDARQRADAYLRHVESSSERSFPSLSQQQTPDAFSELMNAMDAELARLKGPQKNKPYAPRSMDRTASTELPQQASREKEMLGKQSSTLTSLDPSESDEDEDMQDLSEQDAELLERMLHSGPPASLQALLEKDDPEHPLGLSATERTVMHGMLESYKAQNGGAGPVSSLTGRFGLGQLPEDADTLRRGGRK